MIQLALFPCQADDLPEGHYLPLGDGLKVASEACSACSTVVEEGPVGVLGWPRAAPGDPAWERWGVVVVDVPRRARADLLRQSRWRVGQ